MCCNLQGGPVRIQKTAGGRGGRDMPWYLPGLLPALPLPGSQLTAGITSLASPLPVPNTSHQAHWGYNVISFLNAHFSCACVKDTRWKESLHHLRNGESCPRFSPVVSQGNPKLQMPKWPAGCEMGSSLKSDGQTVTLSSPCCPQKSDTNLQLHKARTMYYPSGKNQCGATLSRVHLFPCDLPFHTRALSASIWLVSSSSPMFSLACNWACMSDSYPYIPLGKINYQCNKQPRIPVAWHNQHSSITPIATVHFSLGGFQKAIQMSRPFPSCNLFTLC